MQQLKTDLSESKIEDILIPQLHTNINVSTATNIWQIKLTDNLQKTLRTSKMADYQLAILSGVIHQETEEDATIPTLVLPVCRSVKSFQSAFLEPRGA